MDNNVENLRKTKYFGNIELSFDNSPEFENGWATFHAKLDGQIITVHIEDYNIWGDKLKLCWDFIDKYLEINEIAKNAIIKYFPEENCEVNNYFKYFYENKIKKYGKDKIIEVFEVNDFKKLDIKTLIGKINYPGLSFNLEDGMITIYVEYTLLETFSDDDVSLYVLLDEELKIKDFEVQYES